MFTQEDLRIGLKRKPLLYRFFFYWCVYTSYGARTIIFVGWPIFTILVAVLVLGPIELAGGDVPRADWVFGLCGVGGAGIVLAQRIWVGSRIGDVLTDGKVWR